VSRLVDVVKNVPYSSRLEKRCAQEGRSKGAVVREAIEDLLERSVTKESNLPSIEEITEALRKGKKIKVKADWDEIYRQARVPMDITPEEEVRRGRLRGMIFK
jgi:predicted DNA-binding protein